VIVNWTFERWLVLRPTFLLFGDSEFCSAQGKLHLAIIFNNYCWDNQIAKLQRFVANPMVPPWYLTEHDCVAKDIHSSWAWSLGSLESNVIGLASYSLSLVFLFVLIKFGRKFMSISVFKPSLIHDNCTLQCMLSNLVPNQGKSICSRLKIMLWACWCWYSCAPWRICWCYLEGLPFHLTMLQLYLLLRVRNAHLQLLKLKLFCMDMKHAISMFKRHKL